MVHLIFPILVQFGFSFSFPRCASFEFDGGFQPRLSLVLVSRYRSKVRLKVLWPLSVLRVQCREDCQETLKGERFRAEKPLRYLQNVSSFWEQELTLPTLALPYPPRLLPPPRRFFPPVASVPRPNIFKSDAAGL